MRISDWSSDVCSSDLRVEPQLRPLANQPKQLGYLMTRSSCWAVAFALQALVLPVLGIARDGQVCESSGGRSVTFTTTEATERSEERRVGKEGVRTCRSRWSPCL